MHGGVVVVQVAAADEVAIALRSTPELSVVAEVAVDTIPKSV
jgi:hypothetical protein